MVVVVVVVELRRRPELCYVDREALTGAGGSTKWTRA